MSQTIFITGSSTGIGRATAIEFQKQGWNVVATMRAPDDERELGELENVQVLELDVTRPQVIDAAYEAAVARFGSVDVLVNNAGYGAFGALEAFSFEQIERQFDTNVIGLLSVTKAFIPDFRRRGAGTIVNVSSMGGLYAFPLGSLYHGSKFAVEGITEALYYEMGAIGVRVKLIEPGRVETDFGTRSMDRAMDPEMTEYLPLINALIAASSAPDTTRSTPEEVARKIFEVVTEDSDQVRYAVGADAEQALAARKAMDDTAFLAHIKGVFGL